MQPINNYLTNTDLPELPKKKKGKKLKIFGIILCVSVILFLSINFYTYGGYKEKELVKDLKQQIESQLGQDVEVIDVESEPDRNIYNQLTNVNSRHAVVNNSNDEVFYYAHDGSIGGIGNLTFTDASEGYGFFRHLGDSSNKMTAGWFTSLFADNINTTQINSTTYCNSTSCYTVTQFLNDTDTVFSNTNVCYLNNTQEFTTANTFSHTDLLIAQKLTHNGDPDTYLEFTDDIAEISAGGQSMAAFVEAAQDVIYFNTDNRDIDFQIDGDAVEYLFFIEASTDSIGIGGDSTPDAKLQVTGDVHITTDLDVDRNATVGGNFTASSLFYVLTDIGTLIGATAESIVNAAFTMDGDDFYVEGDSGFNGQVYFNDNLTLAQNTSHILLETTDETPNAIYTSDGTKRTSYDSTGNHIFSVDMDNDASATGVKIYSNAPNSEGDFMAQFTEDDGLEVGAATELCSHTGFTQTVGSIYGNGEFCSNGDMFTDGEFKSSGTITSLDTVISFAASGDITSNGEMSLEMDVARDGGLQAGLITFGSTKHAGCGSSGTDDISCDADWDTPDTGTVWFDAKSFTVTNNLYADRFVGAPFYFACGENSDLDDASDEWSCGGNGETTQRAYIFDDSTLTHLGVSCVTGTGTANITIQKNGAATNCYLISSTTEDRTTCDVDFTDGDLFEPYTVTDTGHAQCILTIRFEVREA